MIILVALYSGVHQIDASGLVNVAWPGTTREIEIERENIENKMEHSTDERRIQNHLSRHLLLFRPFHSHIYKCEWCIVFIIIFWLCLFVSIHFMFLVSFIFLSGSMAFVARIRSFSTSCYFARYFLSVFVVASVAAEPMSCLLFILISRRNDDEWQH